MRFNSRESLSDLDFQGFRNPAGRQVGPQLFQSGPENVETTEQRVVKGGSWADYKYAAMSGSRMGHGQNQSGSRIGFRVAMIKMGSPIPAEF
jgi:formylglycine-generating enzyme required for sulfatase activity